MPAVGTVLGRDLYFHAHGDWTFEVADSAGTLPSDGGAREPDGFYRDGADPHYGWMPLTEAVAVIAECLREYTGGQESAPRTGTENLRRKNDSSEA